MGEVAGNIGLAAQVFEQARRDDGAEDEMAAGQVLVEHWLDIAGGD